MTKKYYLIETQSSFTLQYLVCTEKENKNGRIQHLVDDSKLNEVSQLYLGEKIVGVKEFSEKELHEKYDGDPNIFGEILDHVNDIDQDVVEMLSDEEQL